jgi:three-Cys-motif partner protein
MPVEHDFGGAWTEIKLDAVEYYLKCFTGALSRMRFDLWYVDAFAGTGDRNEQQLTGGLLENKPVEWVTKTLPGSAKRALNVEPPFNHFVFNERHRERRRALKAIRTDNPHLDIEILGDDANEAIREIFSRPVWKRRASGPARGVVFLDPYALQVDWDTLKLLAKTECVDVWYLFPIRDVTRQLSDKITGTRGKEAKLDAVLSPAWRELYELPPPVPRFATTLFGAIPEVAAEERRKTTQSQIEAWFRAKLSDLFPYVSEPLPLHTDVNRQTFSLFLAVANPSKPAIDLAKKFHRYVMKNFGPGASRRRSGR